MFEIAEHTCDVVEIKLTSHPNADTLSLVMVGDFQCAVRTADWANGDLALYIPPDSVVPETKDFEFLGKHRRIKARKLRGEWSVGLLIPAPDGAKIGDDCMEQLGIVHYEPQISSNFSTGGENVRLPRETSKSGLFTPVYDVLNFRKYSELFEDGEEVIVSEKLHGCNSRFVCMDDVIYCGSRKFWKKEDLNNLWWKALDNCDVLQAWLRHHQNLVVYGEIFGQVQNLKYGSTNGEIYFAAFDIWDGSRWLDFDEAHKIGAPLPWVPLVYRGPFDKEKILEFAEGDSNYPGANHYLEGVVVKPVRERGDPKIGRLQLKIVGNRYLSKS
jgi:RNA ligase (TIGR02306 family)